MANALIGEILGAVLGRGSNDGRTEPGGGPGNLGGLGVGLPGGLGGLGAILGGGGGLPGGMRPDGAAGTGGHNAMLALMLPLVLQWVQRNGGIGNVLQRVNQQGYADHATSWIGTGANEPLPADAAHRLLGREELANISGQLGVGEDEVASGFSEILPQVVDRLSPQGRVTSDADRTLEAGQSALERMLGGLR